MLVIFPLCVFVAGILTDLTNAMGRQDNALLDPLPAGDRDAVQITIPHRQTSLISQSNSV